MVRFIHAADLHLDTPFVGLEAASKTLAEKLRQAPYQSLSNIVELAIAEGVDFVLLAGDLYNTERVNIKAQSLFIEELKRLETAEIPVFLTRGNHDYLTDEANTLALPFPDNVYTYGADVDTHVLETKSKERVALSGFSYDSQWVFDRKINDYPKRQQSVDFHLGLLHGAADGVQTEAAHYAPFTLEELRAKHYDYWALGHIHERQQVATHPLAYYPGNIQGLHKNEPGPKGVLLVELADREADVQFVPTAPIIWDDLALDIAGLDNLSQLFQKLEAALGEMDADEDRLIDLRLTANEETDERIVQLVQEDNFALELSKQLGLPHIWFAVVELVVAEDTKGQTLAQLYPDLWAEIVEKTSQPEVFAEMTENLFQQIPNKYLNESNTKDYRQQMIKKAIAKIQLQ